MPDATPSGGAQPTHYEVLLTQPFPVPDLGITIPGGRSTVVASIVMQMPAEIVVEKKPAKA